MEIRLTRHGRHVAVITIDNQPRRNAMTRDMMAELGRMWDTLESDDAVTSFWILGEGEQHHGEHVVSFQAPVGRALVGRRIGDMIELGEPGQKRRWRVVSIERRLPETGARTES